MKVDRKQLQDALERVKPGLANKELIEQSTSFAFVKNRVITYNDEISISHPIEGFQVTGAIQADTLYKFLSKVKKDTIDIEIADNEILFASGRAKAGIALKSEIKLPLLELKDPDWKDLPENFNKSLKFSMGACAKMSDDTVLDCINVKAEGILEASDSLCVAQCDLKEEIKVPNFLLPATSAVEVVKLNPIQIAEGQGWIHFRTEDDTIISCRLSEGSFVSINPHIIVEGVRAVLPKTINEILDRAMVFSKRDHVLLEKIDIIIANNRCKVQATSNYGWFEEEINMVWEHDAIDFSITPYLLKDILLETQECIIGERSLKFQGDGWVYVTALKDK